MKTLIAFAFILQNAFFYSQNIRHIETINECWKFHKGNLQKPFDKDSVLHWEDIDLPHTWNNYDIIDDEDGYYRGVGWYKKSISIPKVYENQNVFLFFEAANQETTVFINGKLAGPTNIGGYTPFVYDITSLANNKNEIAVKVDNSHNEEIIPLSADFNFYGGIYRDVYLIITRTSHFDMLNMGSNGVFITTPLVTEKMATISISATIINPNNKKLYLKNTLLDTDSHIIVEPKEILAQNGENHALLTIEQPKLWSPSSPILYTLVSELTDKKGNIIDRVENPVGFRWFKFDAKTGFYLNGQSLKLIGTNRHQDFFESGFAVSDELHRYDMKLLKDMGINFLRISHYPQDPAFLEMCDRYGIVATLEIPFVNKAAAGEKGLLNTVHMLRKTIRSNYNHPCIVAWGTGNETTMSDPQKLGDVYIKHLQQTHKTLAEIVKEEDTTRYSYTVFFRSPEFHHKLNLRQTEIVGHNIYAGWYGGNIESIKNTISGLAKKSVEIDGKPFILSEYGAGSDPRIRSFNPERFDFSVEYQTLLHKEHLKTILNTPEIVGANVWNFADFQVENRIDAVPHINNKGLVTLKREPKDAYYFYKAALSKEPVLVIPSKLWKNRSGIADTADKLVCTQPVEVYSNLKEAELFLNGISLGKKSFDFHTASWNVPFINGKNLLEVNSGSKWEKIKDFHEIDFQLQPYNLKSKELLFEEIAVNVGSNCYFIEDSNNNYLWIPDQAYRKGSFGYIGGKKHYVNTIGSKQNILVTKNDPIFQTQLIGIEAYRFDVPKGNYELTLCLAEVDNGNMNEMDIIANGDTIWNTLNIKEQYGQNRAVTKRFLINILDEEGLQIEFQAHKGVTRLSGVKLRKIY